MKTSAFGIVGLVANNELALAPLIARGKKHTFAYKFVFTIRIIQWVIFFKSVQQQPFSTEYPTELATAVNSEFTKTKGKAILRWTKMLLSKKGCSQVLTTKPYLRVVEHSFQVPMPNSPLLQFKQFMIWRPFFARVKVNHRIVYSRILA